MNGYLILDIAQSTFMTIISNRRINSDKVATTKIAIPLIHFTISKSLREEIKPADTIFRINCQ